MDTRYKVVSYRELPLAALEGVNDVLGERLEGAEHNIGDGATIF